MYIAKSYLISNFQLHANRLREVGSKMARSLCILIFSTICLGGILAVTGQNVEVLQEDVNQLKTEVAQLKRELALERMKVHSRSGMIRNTSQY